MRTWLQRTLAYLTLVVVLITPAHAATTNPSLTARSLLDSMRDDWKTDVVSRNSNSLLMNSAMLAETSWANDIIPGVNLTNLANFYYRYVGVPLAAILFCLHVMNASAGGRFDGFDLFKRMFVFGGMMAGLDPIFHAMSAVQMGFPSVLKSAAAMSTNPNPARYMDDIAIINRIKLSVKRAENMLVTHMVTYASKMAPPQSYVGQLERKPDGSITSGTVNLAPDNFVNYMMEPLQANIDLITPDMPAESQGSAPVAVNDDWYSSSLELRTSDFARRLDFVLHYNPDIAEMVLNRINDTFYRSTLDRVFMADPAATPIGTAKGIPEVNFKEFEGGLYEAYVAKLVSFPAERNLFVTGISGASGSGTDLAAQETRGKSFSTSARVPKGTSVSGSDLTIFYADTRRAGLRMLGEAPPVETNDSGSWVQNMVNKVNNWISWAVMMLFTYVFNIMLRVQYFFMVLALPFYLNEKTEKAFTNSFLVCLTLVMTPLVGSMMLAIWNMVFASLLAGSVGM